MEADFAANALVYTYVTGAVNCSGYLNVSSTHPSQFKFMARHVPHPCTFSLTSLSHILLMMHIPIGLTEEMAPTGLQVSGGIFLGIPRSSASGNPITDNIEDNEGDGTTSDVQCPTHLTTMLTAGVPSGCRRASTLFKSHHCDTASHVLMDSVRRALIP